MRQKLSVASGGNDQRATTVAAALRNRRCLRGRYNGGSVVLAPYLFYRRHDVLHLAALTLLRDGTPGRADKLSVYRLAGLTDVELDGQPFDPDRQLIDTHQHPVDTLLGSVVGDPD